ncbi:MAG: DNA-binding protein WhiA [Clostridia bacterium]|nr:DNA-binding protein WhiA [Clostridia bacterium]
MSFCSEAKKEILSKKLKKIELKPFLAALTRTIGEVLETQDGKYFQLKTEFLDILKPLNSFLKANYNVEIDFNGKTETIFSKTKEIIEIPKNITSDFLQKLKYWDKDNNEILGIDDEFFLTHETRIGYMKGIFVGCSTSNIVLDDISKSGSHLEFVFSCQELAFDFMEMLAKEDILAKKIKRRNNFVVYLIKGNNDDIFNLVGMLEANNSALKLKSKEAYKQLSNNINRQTNCITSNTNKTIEASIKQRIAINIIEETIGISCLPTDLQEICYLRIHNPDISLNDMQELLEGKFTKSGLNHRLKKIIEISKNLKN